MDETRPDIPASLQKLRSNVPDERVQAQVELTREVAHRLSDLARGMDDAIGSEQPVVGPVTPEVIDQISRLLFGVQPDPSSVPEFYSRAGAAIRSLLLSRLGRLAKNARTPEARRRFAGWRDVHQVANTLPLRQRTVLDVMHYGGRTKRQTAEILRMTASEFDKEAARLEKRLQTFLEPLLTKDPARGAS